MNTLRKAKLYAISALAVGMLSTAALGFAASTRRGPLNDPKCGGAACDVAPHNCGPNCFCEDQVTCHLN